MLHFAGGQRPTGQFAAALVEASVESFALVDEMARILYVASMAPDLLGQSVESMVGRSLLDYTRADAHPAIISKLEDLMTADGPSTTVIQAVAETDADWLEIELRGFNRVDYDGIPAAYISVRDRTLHSGSVRARSTARLTLSSEGDGYSDSTAGKILSRTLRGLVIRQQSLAILIQLTSADNLDPDELSAAVLGCAGRIADHSRRSDVVARVGDDALLVILVDLEAKARMHDLAARVFEQCLLDDGSAHDFELGYAAASADDDYKDVLAFIRQAAQFTT